jgi:hypothetical protein
MAGRIKLKVGGTTWFAVSAGVQPCGERVPIQASSRGAILPVSAKYQDGRPSLSVLSGIALLSGVGPSGWTALLQAG